MAQGRARKYARLLRGAAPSSTLRRAAIRKAKVVAIFLRCTKGERVRRQVAVHLFPANRTTQKPGENASLYFPFRILSIA